MREWGSEEAPFGQTLLIKILVVALKKDPKKSKFLKIMTRRSYKQNLIRVDKRRKLTPNMVSFIINPDTVKKWAGLSLDARAVMFHR